MPSLMIRFASKFMLLAALCIGASPVFAADWLATSMPWASLPTGSALGSLPQAVMISPRAYEYAARSSRVDVFGKIQPTIIKVTLQISSGEAGLLLVSPDGKTVLSKEAVLKPSGKDEDFYFRMRPESPPSLIIMRNLGTPGRGGLAVIKSVQFIREGSLDNEQLAALFQTGLY